LFFKQVCVIVDWTLPGSLLGVETKIKKSIAHSFLITAMTHILKVSMTAKKKFSEISFDYANYLLKVTQNSEVSI
jgi:hypothetical protein